MTCPPPHWTSEELDRDSAAASTQFRKKRLVVSDTWAKHYHSAVNKFELLFQILHDLRLDRVGDDDLVRVYDLNLGEALRYLAGPPISDDDLRVIADIDSLVPGVLRKNPDLVRRIFSVITTIIDPHRFPWVHQNTNPAESQRSAAILASATLLASQRIATARRMDGNDEQESKLRDYLQNLGLTLAPVKRINREVCILKPGQFCMGCQVADRKADVVVGLYDSRLLVIECKVSNSATNSVKRLNNDAAVKASYWLSLFGQERLIPAALLSGVFKVVNLEQAQNRGLRLFWGHDLEKLGDFIKSTQV